METSISSKSNRPKAEQIQMQRHMVLAICEAVWFYSTYFFQICVTILLQMRWGRLKMGYPTIHWFITIFPNAVSQYFFCLFWGRPIPGSPRSNMAPEKAEKEEPAKEEPKVEARPGCDTEVCKILTVKYCKPLYCTRYCPIPYFR